MWSFAQVFGGRNDFLKSQRCWGLTGFKDFPGLKINVKASIVLNKFMKKGHLGYLGVGYVSR